VVNEVLQYCPFFFLICPLHVSKNTKKKFLPSVDVLELLHFDVSEQEVLL